MIRESIKEIMKSRQVKQKELAEYIGVTKVTMSAFLAGKINLGLEKVELILDFLKISLTAESNKEKNRRQRISGQDLKH